MKPAALTWQITWRSALRILGLGALFGGIYGPSVLVVLLFTDGMQQGVRSVSGAPTQLLSILLFAVVVGALIGSPLGAIVGTLIGLLISAITVYRFLPLDNPPRYVQVVQRSSTLAGGIGTLVGAPLVSFVLFGQSTVTEEIGMLAIFGIIPALLACQAIWRASGQIAGWYVRTATAATPAQPRDARIAP